jgi:hypothetical protein
MIRRKMIGERNAAGSPFAKKGGIPRRLIGGGGNVWIDENGLTIDSSDATSMLRFYSGATIAFIYSGGYGDIYISPAGGRTIIAVGDIDPAVSLTYNLGSSSLVWLEIFVNNISGSSGTSIAFKNNLIPGGDNTLDFGSSARGIKVAYINEITSNLTQLTVNDTIRPGASNTYNLGASSLYYAEIHVATGGVIEHSPRKFSPSSIELIRQITYDSEGRIIVPESLRKSGGTSIGSLAYVAVDAAKYLLQRVEILESHMKEYPIGT